MEFLERALRACGAGVRPVTLALAMMATLPAFAGESGSLGISITVPIGAPEQVYLMPKGTTNPQSSLGLIELQARQRASETAYYQGDAPAGEYLLVARAGSVFRPADPALPALRVVAGVHTDFGRVWVDTLGGNQWVLMRDPTAPDNSGQFSGLPREAGPGWDAPVSAQEAALLDRAKRRVAVSVPPLELADGTWMTWSRKGGVVLRDAAGQWRAVARLPAGHRLAAAHSLSASDYVMADEFGALYRGGTQVERVGQLPPGRVQFLQCTTALACVALLERDDGQVAVQSRDATAGNWTEAVQFPKPGVLRNIFPAHAGALPGYTALGFGKDLWVVDLTTGTVQQTALPWGDAFLLQASGDLLLGAERYSRDRGQSWQKIEIGLADALLHLGQDDVAWSVQRKFALKPTNPDLRRRTEGKWRDAAPLPAPGQLRVGRASRVMYLADRYQPDRLWMSLDDGATWSADRSLQAALEAL